MPTCPQNEHTIELMKALDTADSTTGKAHDILNAGYGAVGLYLRSDRTSLQSVQGLHSVGLKIWFVWESGYPTSGDYFTADQGEHDGLSAAKYAGELGVPSRTQLFAAVDFDADWDNDGDGITEYFTAYQTAVKSWGYLASVYGSGLVCEKLVEAGLAHSGWLAGATGWAGYANFKPKACIVQALEAKVLGMDVDLDEVIDQSVLW